MASVSPYLRKDKINSNGECGIYIRVTKDRSPIYLATGVRAKTEDWDASKCKIKNKVNNSTRKNHLITQQNADVEAKVLALLAKHPNASKEQIKAAVTNAKAPSFFSYADQILTRLLQSGKISYHDKNKGIISKLKVYAKNKDLALTDITPKYLREYEYYLKSVLKNSNNTIHTNFRFIRKVLNDAEKDGLINSGSSPFKVFKMTLEKTERTFLLENEIIALKNLVLKDTKLDLVRDMFVFSSYCGGIRVSDMLLLKWENIDDTHVRYKMKKTDTTSFIKLTSVCSSILEKYKSQYDKTLPYVFPMLNIVDESDPIKLDAAIASKTASINRYLKVLAIKAKINKNLSFHISRHSFATLALTKGISIDKVSKLLGHANIKETQIYAKIVNKALDDAMDAFE